MSLNAKRQRFVSEYLVDCNATQAAIRAGYSKKTAYSIGEELLRIPEVAEAVAERQEKIAQKLEITQESIIAELAKIGFANMQDYIRIHEGDPYLDFSTLTREQAAPIVEMVVEDFTEGRGENARDVRRVRFKLSDKQSALVNLGKHLGMFKETIRLDVAGLAEELEAARKRATA